MDGNFPALGWHIAGEMGGVWTPPLKMIDGLWLRIDGHWVQPAARYTAHGGLVRV